MWNKRFLVTVMLLSACATTDGGFKGFKTKNFAEFRDMVTQQVNDTELFQRPGPFSVEKREDFEIRVSKEELINTDLYLSRHESKAPLVIIQHGNGGLKDYHEEQARLLASWGFHVLVLQQPNVKRWVKNGKVLADLTVLLKTWPTLLDSEFDPDNIILAGHSFGGSAIAIAASAGAPVKGLIFLDPAMVNTKIREHLKSINKPAIILGADEEVFTSRRRKQFFASLSKEVLEVSVKDATHNDAQYPDEFEVGKLFGFADWTSPERQSRFAGALVASAFSLSANGKTAFIWKAIQPEIKRGTLIQARRKLDRIDEKSSINIDN